MQSDRNGHRTSKRRGAEGDVGHPADGTPELDDSTIAFEEALGRLDEIVALLEDGQLPLDQTLERYEDGMRLAQRCQELLDAAELRVQQLRILGDADDGLGDGLGEALSFHLETFDLDDR